MEKLVENTIMNGISVGDFETSLRDVPGWLWEIKENAWETFNNLSENNKREKFKDVIESLEIENKALKNVLGSPSNNDEFKNFWGELGGSYTFGGASQLSDELTKKGVILKSLKSALVENESLVKPYLVKSNLTSRDSRFTALAEALWTDGVFLYVPKDVEVSLPVHLLKWTDKGGSQSYYKTLVIADERSKLLLIDEYDSENTDDFFIVDGINEIHVKDSASVRYLHLQNFDYNAFNFSLQRTVVGKDATLKLLSVSIGSQFSYENVRSYMEQSGGNAQLLGLVIGDDEQIFQHETLQYHPVPSSTSNLHFEVMLKGKSESAHNGFVLIEKPAILSDSHQLIRNLLLSRTAKAEAIPNLEILADDVKCSHGVSLGPVNPEELFYLMSRGFDQEQAANLIIEGTVENIIHKIDDEELEEKVRDFVLKNLQRRGA